jgi:hypothetical protein
MAVELALEEAEVGVGAIVEERLSGGEEAGGERSMGGWEHCCRRLGFDVVGGGMEGDPFTPPLNEFDLFLLVNFLGLEHKYVVEDASAS